MSPLETVLVVLVSLWTIIFIIITIALVVLIFWVKSMLNKVNRILDHGEDVARGIGAMSRSGLTGIGGLLVRAAGDRLKKNIRKKTSKNR